MVCIPRSLDTSLPVQFMVGVQRFSRLGLCSSRSSGNRLHHRHSPLSLSRLRRILLFGVVSEICRLAFNEFFELLTDGCVAYVLDVPARGRDWLSELAGLDLTLRSQVCFSGPFGNSMARRRLKQSRSSAKKAGSYLLSRLEPIFLRAKISGYYC